MRITHPNRSMKFIYSNNITANIKIHLSFNLKQKHWPVYVKRIPFETFPSHLLIASWFYSAMPSLFVRVWGYFICLPIWHTVQFTIGMGMEQHLSSSPYRSNWESLLSFSYVVPWEKSLLSEKKNQREREREIIYHNLTFLLVWLWFKGITTIIFHHYALDVLGFRKFRVEFGIFVNRPDVWHWGQLWLWILWFPTISEKWEGLFGIPQKTE